MTRGRFAVLVAAAFVAVLSSDAGAQVAPRKDAPWTTRSSMNQDHVQDRMVFDPGPTGSGATGLGTGSADFRYTPPPPPVGQWAFQTYYIQTQGTNGFIISYLNLVCYPGGSVCNTPAPSVTSCWVTGYGYPNTCPSGYPLF